ncbi:MAG TPA: thiamine pyrophosphate-dependent dehydrogenase E1 component subunit alpha, partial [Puia sp.]|nr:thiamine pyrophosphate-dependent dehydrogenase E1 component subunit alpha [Puia sp.]
KDYRTAYESREVSLLGRKEVLTGKAKFGIFGDGKEVPQVALSKFFRPGDFFAGYYRDQTIAFASGIATIEEFFAQLYADPDPNNDPHSSGRQMNSHFATEFVDKDGEIVDLVNRKNFTAGLAPTAAHMPRALGLAFASKAFREVKELEAFKQYSNKGSEVCFCSIGDASTSEGHFWETMNAAGVLQVPLAVFVWDDGYGISVPTKYQTTKGSISEAMKGFQKKDGTNGIDIYKVKGWDYAGMCELFEAAIQKIRVTHIPALFHVEEVTQPQGHSTSGSHERYKTPERLEWERKWDGIRKMREWIVDNALASEEELDDIEAESKEWVRKCKAAAWEKYQVPIKEQVNKAVSLIHELAEEIHEHRSEILKISDQLATNREPNRRDVLETLHHAIMVANDPTQSRFVKDFYDELKKENKQVYNSHLLHEGKKNILSVPEIKPEYNDNP